MEASGADISGTALFNNDGRGFNSEIRMRDVITNYIYPNTLAVLKVSGEDLRKALERVATYFIVENGQAASILNMWNQNPNNLQLRYVRGNRVHIRLH